MGLWLKTGRIYKANLAAGSVAALLLVAACGDEDKNAESGAAASSAESVAVSAIDAAQAPVIQKAIEDYLAVLEGPADARVVHHDSVKVTPGSDAFEVVIAGIVIGAKDEERLEVGDVGYRLTPKGSDSFVASNLTHAGAFPFKERDGNITGQLSLATKTFSGEWSSAAQTFLALDWQAADLVAEDKRPDGGKFTAAGLTTSLASTDKGSGLFDQSGKFELTQFSAKDTTGGSFEVGKLSFNGLMTGIKLKEYVAKTREMQALMADIAEMAAKAQAAAEEAAKKAAEGGTAAPEVTVTTGPSEEQSKKLGEMIKGMAGLVSGVTYNVALTDIAGKNKDGSEPFQLAKGTFDLGFTGLDVEKAGMTFAIGHEGLVIKDPAYTGDPIFAKLLPATGKLDLNLTDVPSKELWQLIGDNFPGLMTADPVQSEAAVGSMFMAMQQLLQKAPMKLTVAPSNLVSELIQLDATGAFDVKPEAMFGAVGALDVNLHGLDEAMKLANEAAQSSPNAAQVVGTLAMIQSMAKRETGSDGKPVDKLKIEVDAQGDTKVNGVSMSGMQ